jgi:hypothetical protein
MLCERYKFKSPKKISGEGSAGVVEKWVVKIKNAPVLCEKCKS